MIFSRAGISPDKIICGGSDTFSITLVCGKQFSPNPSRIIIDFECMLGTSRPSLLHQEDYGFIDVSLSNPDVKYECKIWNMELGEFCQESKNLDFQQMKAQRQFVLDLGSGMKENDIIEIRWGNNSRGYTPGAQVTTIVPYPGYKNIIHVRYFSDQARGFPDFGRSFKGYERPEPECEIPLTIEILPRATRYVQVIRRATGRGLLIPRDLFWNVADEKKISFAGVKGKTIRNRHGAFEFDNSAFTVKKSKHVILESAPMNKVYKNYNIYWGDIHTHSCYSNDCIEREKLGITPSDLMSYARFAAGLDFYGVSDHHQPWDKERHKIGKASWDLTIEDVRRHHNEDFCVFPGIEFRCPRGDTVAVFGYTPDYSEIDRPELCSVEKFWKAFPGKDFITIPHFHNIGNLAPDEWQSAETNIEPVVEIFSCHGSYESPDALEHKIPLIKRRRHDRYGSYFLQKGFKYGTAANSDGHKGHAGLNGLTAVFSESLDRASILQAYRARRVYATTNARIRLLFTGNGAFMGQTAANESRKVFFTDITGENKLKKIDLMKNGILYTRLIPDGKTFQREIIINDAEPAAWYVRVTQTDNHIAWSSPVWFES